MFDNLFIFLFQFKDLAPCLGLQTAMIDFLCFTLKQRRLGGCCLQKYEGKKRLVAYAALYQHALHQRLWEPRAFENQIIAGQNPLSW